MRKVDVPDNWTVEDGSYILGNKYHPCAVAVIWRDDEKETCKKLVTTAHEMGVAIVGTVRTNNIGVAKIICNILANPNIRWLIVVGKDNEFRTGETLVKLCRGNDISDIPNARIPLPQEAIERFRRQVQVIDMVDVTDADLLKAVIYGTIQEPENAVEVEIKGVKYRLFDPGAFDDKPYRVSLVDYVAARIEPYEAVKAAALPELDPYPHVGISIVAPTLRDGYKQVLKLIRELGIENPTRHGLTKELQYVTIKYLKVPWFRFKECGNYIKVLDMDTSDIPKEVPFDKQFYTEYIERGYLNAVYAIGRLSLIHI